MIPGLMPNMDRPYHTKYIDVAQDPCRGDPAAYARIYAHYSTQGPTALAPAALRSLVFDNVTNGMPVGHVLLVNDAPGQAGKVTGFHQPMQYPQALLRPTPFDNSAFAIAGDCHQGQLPYMVEWNNNHYHQAAMVQVPTAAAIDQLLAADPAVQVLGPFQAGAPDTEGVQVRYTQYIPNRYLALLLGESFTPREAWITIRGALVNQGWNAACQPLIDWLRVALTCSTNGQPSVLARPVPAAPDMVNLPADPQAWDEFRTRVQARDLPNLRGSQVTQGAQLVATGLNSMATETRLHREADEAHRQRQLVKQPSSLFSVRTSLQRILRLTLAAGEADLPEVYHTLANTPKGRHRPVLEDLMGQSLMDLGYDQSQRGYPLSSKTANKILDARLSGFNKDVLAEGLSCFTVGHQAEEVSKAARDNNTQADQVTGSEAAPSVSDVSKILDADKDVHVPRTLPQLMEGMQNLHALLHCLLECGQRHPLLLAHKEYLDKLGGKLASLENEAVPTLAGYAPGAAGVSFALARRHQLELVHYLSAQALSDTEIAAPDFNRVFDELDMGAMWWRAVPKAYRMPTVPPPAAPRAPPAAPGQQPAPGPQQVVRNTEWKSIFEPYKAQNISTRPLKEALAARNVAWPRVGNRDACLTWHVKGMCNSRCGYAADHAPHTEAEDAALASWCAANYRL